MPQNAQQYHTTQSLIEAIVRSLDASIGKEFAQKMFDIGMAKIVTMDDALPLLENHVFFKKTADTKDIQAFFNPIDQTSYFIADHIRADDTDEHIKGIVLHEIGVHALQLGKDSHEFDDILKRVEQLREIHSLVQTAYLNVPEDTPPEHVHEEALAYLVEHHPQLSVCQRFMSWFKSMLGNIGIKRPLSVEDIVYMAHSALKTSTDQDALHKANNKGVRFSVAADQKSPAWRRWFSGSKTVRRGKPIVYYHGTSGNFTVFDKSKLATNTTHPTAGLGHFFSDDMEVSAGYGGKLLKVYLSIKNPYVTTSNILDTKFNDADGAIRFRDKLKKEGYDGVYIKDAKYMVAFESYQIKLTDNHTPTFASDIRFSVASRNKPEDELCANLVYGESSGVLLLISGLFNAVDEFHASNDLS